MSGMYEGAIQDLIDALGRLPGIGPKSAQRIAFHILQADAEIATALVDSIRTVKERVKFCVECGNVSEEDQCRICRDPRRDNTLICVVDPSIDTNTPAARETRTSEAPSDKTLLSGAALLAQELGAKVIESK